MVDESKIICMANYMIDYNSTIRKTATEFGVSKSTVYINLAVRLASIDDELYCKVRNVLNKNKAERHVRGGMATAEKYRKLKKE